MMEKPRAIVNKENLEDTFMELKISSPVQLRVEDRRLFPELYAGETPLNEMETKTIEMLNDKIDTFAKKYYSNILPVHKEDVHKVSKEALSNFTQIEGVLALYNIKSHQIYFRETNNTVVVFAHLLHEMIHAKSFTLFRKKITGEGLVLGLEQNGITSADTEYHYFDNLNEAITEYLSQKLSKESTKDTKFRESSDKMIQDINLTRSSMGLPLKDSNEVISFEVVQFNDGIPEIDTVEHAYKPQRRFFETVLEDIQRHNPAEFSNLEKAEDIFFKAYFTGNFAEMEKVIEDTYGIGTVNKLKLIDRKKDIEQSDFDRIGYKLSALIENIKNESQR